MARYDASVACHMVVYSAGPTIRINDLSKLSTQDFASVLNADAVDCFDFVHAVMRALRNM